MKRKTIGLLLAAALLLSGCSMAKSGGELAPGDAMNMDSNMYPSYDILENGGETYQEIIENPEVTAEEKSTVTFSLKVDTASYSNVTRYLNTGSLPPKDAVRTEELINYFRYETPLEPDGAPFAVYTEVGPSPFHSGKQMAFIRVKTPEIDKNELGPSNLTFLLDTSGSMDSFDKLPLLKSAFSLLVETLGEDDRVSIVTYAGSSAVVLHRRCGRHPDRLRARAEKFPRKRQQPGNSRDRWRF